MIRCHITVRTAGIRHVYTGIFHSTADAAQDALDRFGICHVSVWPESRP
jgi:hypothetical protein